MPYTVLATSKTPALVVYVLDVSASMEQALGQKRRIDVVQEALAAAIRQMVFRSTRGVRVASRYRIAIFAYSDQVIDLLEGVRPVDHLAVMGIPELQPIRTTDTAQAFYYVERLLERELPNIQECPAPIVCHLTDGEYTGADPEPIIRRIMNMQNADGNVLVENIFISDQLLPSTIVNPRHWHGITPSSILNSDYAKKLRGFSSPLPESYRGMMAEVGYHLSSDAVMLLPGPYPEFVEMGFVMSAATSVAR